MKRSNIARRLFRVIEILVDIIALAFSLQLLVDIEKCRTNTVLAIFALNTCACVLCVFNTEKSNKTEFVKYIVYASAYFAGSVLILIFTDRERIVALSFIIYAAAMIFGRVLSIRHKHKTANSVLNIIMIVIWAILCLGVILTGSLGGSLAAVILGITVPVQLLIRTIQLSFSHIRYDMVHISTYGLLPRYSELRKPKAPCGELLLYVRT